MAQDLGSVRLDGLQVGISTIPAGWKLTSTGIGGTATWQQDTLPDHVPTTRTDTSLVLDNTIGFVEFYGSTAAQSITLPQITTAHAGRRYIIVNNASESVNLTPNAADKIGSGGAGVALVIQASDQISVVAGPSTSAAPTWYIGV